MAEITAKPMVQPVYRPGFVTQSQQAKSPASVQQVQRPAPMTISGDTPSGTKSTEQQAREVQPGLPTNPSELSEVQKAEHDKIVAEEEKALAPVVASIESQKQAVSNAQSTVDSILPAGSPDEDRIRQTAEYQEAAGQLIDAQNLLRDYQNQYEALARSYQEKRLTTAGYTFASTTPRPGEISKAYEQTATLAKGGKEAFDYALKEGLIKDKEAIYIDLGKGKWGYTTPAQQREQINALVTAGVLTSNDLNSLDLNTDLTEKLNLAVDKYNQNVKVEQDKYNVALKELEPYKTDGGYDLRKARQSGVAMSTLMTLGFRIEDIVNADAPDIVLPKTEESNLVFMPPEAVTATVVSINNIQDSDTRDFLMGLFQKALASGNPADYKAYNDTAQNYSAGQIYNIQQQLDAIPDKGAREQLTTLLAQATKSGDFKTFDAALSNHYDAVQQIEFKSFQENNVKLPDGNYIAKTDLETTKTDDPELYKALTTGGLLAAEIYAQSQQRRIDEQNAALAKIEKIYPSIKDIDGNYDIAGFIGSGYGRVQEDKAKLLLAAGFNPNDVTAIRTEVNRPLEVKVWRGMTPWKEESGEKASAKGVAIMAAENLLPVVYTVGHWKSLSAVEKAISIGTDALFMLPVVGGAAKGAKAVSVAGRAARLGGAIKGIAESGVAMLRAPVDLVIHPVAGVKSAASDIRNIAEVLAHPKRLPSVVVGTTYSTIRIRVGKDMSAADALVARDAIVREATMSAQAGARPRIQIGNQIVELTPSPLMRELGGGAVSGTPAGKKLLTSNVVEGVVGKPVAEQGLFFSPEPLPRFSEASAFGKTAVDESAFVIMSPETAKRYAVSSGKLYKAPIGLVAEVELKLPVGAPIPEVNQTLFTRLPSGKLARIYLEKTLSVVQIAKLKAIGLVEPFAVPFKPALTIKGAGALSAVTDAEAYELYRAVRDSGNIRQARALALAVGVTRLTNRVTPQRLEDIVGRVTVEDRARAVSRLATELGRARLPVRAEPYRSVVRGISRVTVSPDRRSVVISSGDRVGRAGFTREGVVQRELLRSESPRRMDRIDSGRVPDRAVRVDRVTDLRGRTEVSRVPTSRVIRRPERIMPTDVSRPPRRPPPSASRIVRPPRITPPVRVVPPIRIPPPPGVRPPTVRPPRIGIVGGTDADKRRYIKKADAAFYWQQGYLHKKVVNHVVFLIGGKWRKTVVLGASPIGAKRVSNKGQAYATIKLIRGEAPTDPVTFEGGAIDPTVFAVNRKTVGIRFDVDKRYNHEISGKDRANRGVRVRTGKSRRVRTGQPSVGRIR